MFNILPPSWFRPWHWLLLLGTLALSAIVRMCWDRLRKKHLDGFVDSRIDDAGKKLGPLFTSIGLKPGEPAGIASTEQADSTKPAQGAEDDRRRPPGRPLHDAFELPERLTFERLITRWGIDWRCETREGFLLGTPIPTCPLCGDDALFNQYAEPSYVKAWCSNGDCGFGVSIRLSMEELCTRAREEIEGQLRRDFRQ